LFSPSSSSRERLRLLAAALVRFLAVMLLSSGALDGNGRKSLRGGDAVEENRWHVLSCRLNQINLNVAVQFEMGTYLASSYS
jgi:hypothetical protein